MSLILSVENEKKGRRAQAAGKDKVYLVYGPTYHKGDSILLEVSDPGLYRIHLEDAMDPAVVYIEKKAVFSIPFGFGKRLTYSPRAFKGKQHLIRAEKVSPEEAGLIRNLAVNPYDQEGETGMYPHAKASVITRNSANFAARNAIDGLICPLHHYPYPHGSWGINKDPNASLTLSFGREVCIDHLVLTLRHDRPHDSWWTEGDVEFSDGTREHLHFTDTEEPQLFSITPRTITELTLKNLIKHQDDSPFPALTQIEVWGREAGFFHST